MSQRLTGKTALISAAAQGIGLATTEAFIAEGAKVIATDINMDLLKPLANNPNVQIHQLDVTDGNSVRLAAQQLGAVDILVNIAGFVHHGTILECDEQAWDFSMALNVKSMYRVISAFLPAMLNAGGGSIVNMASVASSLKGIVSRCVYGASKAAVIGLTKSVAADYISQGIRCNAICPGTIQTPSLDDRINAFADPVTAREQFIARQPMGRLGTAAEIAALVVYLASDESAYTTGTVMVADGGITL